MTDGPHKLPSGWRWVRLGEVTQREAVAIQPSKSPDRLFNYLGLEQLASGQWEKPEENQVFGSEVKSTCFEFQPGYVLYAKLRPYLNKVVVCSRKGVCSTEFIPFLPQPSVLTPEFLAAYLRSPWFVDYASHTITGSRMPRVSMETIGNAPIPLPSLAEQRHIVARVETLMERVHEAKRLRCEAQMDADILLNAAIADAFSEIGTHRLPLLDVLLEKPRNGWSPPCDNVPEGTPILKLGAVLGFRFNPSAVKRTSLPVNPKAHYWLSKGDILISRSNTPELVAHAAVYSGEPNPCIYPDLLMRMRIEPSRADPQFIIYWLQSEEARTYIRAHAKGASSTMKKITQGEICDLPFPRIEVDDQRRIVAYLDSVQKQGTALKRAQEDTDAELRRLEQAILDRAFRGEL